MEQEGFVAVSLWRLRKRSWDHFGRVGGVGGVDGVDAGRAGWDGFTWRQRVEEER
jgi:hypothetical protein